MSKKKSKNADNRAGTPPTQRQLRVGGEIRRVLSQVLMRGDFPVSFNTPITVSQVKISPDFSVAWAFIMPLSGHKIEESLEFLNKNSWWFRKAVAKEVNLRITPELRFALDDSFEEALKIETLLASEVVRRDVENDSE